MNDNEHLPSPAGKEKERSRASLPRVGRFSGFPRAAAVLAILAMLVLPACRADPSAAAAGQANDRDVVFAQQIIAHNNQTLEMAQIANEKSQDKRIKSLTKRLTSGKERETKQLTDWLTAWGQPIDLKPVQMPVLRNQLDAIVNEHHLMGGGVVGGASEREIASLKAADAKTFDVLYLAMMVRLHQGALNVADREVVQGQYDKAVDLAKVIKARNESQIQDLLKTLEAIQQSGGGVINEGS